MALITSHVLNGLDGSHAGGIEAALNKVDGDEPIVRGKTDEGGRLALDVDPAKLISNTAYELVFEMHTYWSSRGIDEKDMISQIVLRFKVPNISGTLHMPVIASPFSYSTWKSG